MKPIPVRTVLVPPPSTSIDLARVTMPAAPWEPYERVVWVDTPEATTGPEIGPPARPDGRGNQ